MPISLLRQATTHSQWHLRTQRQSLILLTQHGRSRMSHTAWNAAGLIHPQRVDQPVRLCECAGIVPNIVYTAGGESGAFRRTREDRAGPVAAKGRVEHLEICVRNDRGIPGVRVKDVQSADS